MQNLNKLKDYLTERSKSSVDESETKLYQEKKQFVEALFHDLAVRCQAYVKARLGPSYKQWIKKLSEDQLQSKETLKFWADELIDVYIDDPPHNSLAVSHFKELLSSDYNPSKFNPAGLFNYLTYLWIYYTYLAEHISVPRLDLALGKLSFAIGKRLFETDKSAGKQEGIKTQEKHSQETKDLVIAIRDEMKARGKEPTKNEVHRKINRLFNGLHDGRSLKIPSEYQELLNRVFNRLQERAKKKDPDNPEAPGLSLSTVQRALSSVYR